MITVRMLIARVWQDAGVERRLDVGEVHELPDVVACAFIATGAARRVEGEDEHEADDKRRKHSV